MSLVKDNDMPKRSGFIKGDHPWQISARKMINPPIYDDAIDLLNDVCEYFNWLHDNPIIVKKLVSYQGISVLEDVPVMRAPTLQSMCGYLGIKRTTWGGWRRGEHAAHLQEVAKWADDRMYELKFEGAAAGILNPNLVARDLGLAERTEITSPDGSMSPNRELSREELLKEMERRGLPIPDLD